MAIPHTDNEFNLLITFIREEIGEFNLEIMDNTLLEDDLGVTGGDAVDLIVKYGAKFHVNIDEFDFKKYFNAEPSIFNTLSHIKSFTVGDLYAGIQAGKLI